MIQEPFLPTNLGSVTISVGAAAVLTAIPSGTKSTTNAWRSGGETLRLSNMAAAGGINIYIETSPGGAITATVANSTVIRGGESVTMRRAPGDDFISAIADGAGPTNLIVAVGNGAT